MECYPSRVKIFGLLALTYLMVGLSYHSTTLPSLKAKVGGWIGVVFFGLGFIAIPVASFRRGPQVIINDEGIEDRRLKIGVIRWEDIRSLYIRSVYPTKVLCIEVADPEKYLSRMPRWKWVIAITEALLGFPPFAISFAGLTPGIDEVWEYLQPRVPGR